MAEEPTSFQAGIDFESVLRIISKQIYATPLAFSSSSHYRFSNKEHTGKRAVHHEYSPIQSLPASPHTHRARKKRNGSPGADMVQFRELFLRQVFRQCEKEGAACSRLRFHPGLSAVQLNNFFDNSQPDPCVFFFIPRVQGLKNLKDLFMILL